MTSGLSKEVILEPLNRCVLSLQNNCHPWCHCYSYPESCQFPNWLNVTCFCLLIPIYLVHDDS